MAEKRQRCCLCGIDMEMGQAAFAYMDKHFNHELLRCPSCGQVYIPEEMVREKILEVEQIMEEK
jgi:uncharacterized protein with PIN domain